jgi:hypothetical protein
MGYRIDLVVEGGNGRRLAIECDGDKYHGPERWADDMRRQRILERVGWRFWRCWASSFTLDPDGCMLDLFATLERHGIEPGGAAHNQTTFTLHVTLQEQPTSHQKPGEFVDESRVETARKSASTARRILSDRDTIRVGDRVVIRHLDDNKTVAFKLSTARDDIVNGFLSADSPLGMGLLSAAEEDEVEFEVGGRTRRVLVLAVERAAAAA